MFYCPPTKMTRNDIKRLFPKVYFVHFSELTKLLSYQDPIGHNSGVYGWNYNVFSLNGKAALCTGIRKMPGKEIPTNITSYYNKRAEEIFHNPILSYEEKTRI